MAGQETPAVQIKDTEWLEQNLSSVDIIDCQPDVYDYLHSHIPNSVYLSDKMLRTWRDVVPTRYIYPESIAAMLRNAGISGGAPVVVYSGSGSFTRQGDGLEASMFAYSLARHGVTNIIYIDGGFDKWKKERRPVTKEFPSVEPADLTVKVQPQPDLFLTYSQFQEMRNLDTSFVIDVRPPEVYELSNLWTKPGHIPGAHNIPWHSFVDSQNVYLFKPVEHIREIVLSCGAAPEKTIAVYCGTGREATVSYLTFKWLLGYPNVKLFEGSFTEWCVMKQETATGRLP